MFLNVEEIETEKIYSGCVKIMQLVTLAKQGVENVGNIDPDLYTPPFDRIQQGFLTIGLNHKWIQFDKYLDPATITSLKFCADDLKKNAGERMVAEETLIELQEEIEQLLEDVIQAELPSELRVLLHEKLKEMEQAIIDYRFTGTGEMRHALESTIGGLVFTYGLYGNMDKEDGFIQSKVMPFVRKYANVATNEAFKQLGSGSAGFVVGMLADGLS